MIRVGTGNPRKVEAVREVLAEYDKFADAEVVGVDVNTGVSEQPMSQAATIRGAINRAVNAYDGGYSVGIESGFFSVPESESGYMEKTVCVLYDGDDTVLGFSPAFECPPAVMEHVLDGKDLDEACYCAGITEDKELGKSEGIVGLLTKGRKTRKEYTKDALVMALVQVENDEWY